MSQVPLFGHILVLIKGAGDLASGIAYRVHRAGFPVVMTEIAQPTAVRRTVAFAEAVYLGETQVEGLVARRVNELQEALALAQRGLISVVIDPAGKSVRLLQPSVVVDTIMAKRNTGTHITDAPLVVALGPGFTAGVDCHAVVETNRGHNLGRVMWQGQAETDTGVPGEIGGYVVQRVLWAPRSGTVRAAHAIGNRVEAGEVVAWVDKEPSRAPCAGVLRGVLNEGLKVPAGMKIGDVDPRARPEHCLTISDKALAVGGGVVEAILSAQQVRERLKVG